jgi:FkbM family methyltransferase
MCAPFGEIQGMSLILDGYWEQELTTRILENLAPGGVFIDVGANMGYYTTMAAKAVGPEGLVIAFEPSPTNLQFLLRNLALNHARNVVVFSVALSDRAGIAKLWSAPFYNSGVCSMRGPDFAESSSDYVRIASLRLDDLQTLHQHMPRISVIKLDTEGLEFQALRGAEELLRTSERLSLTCELSPQWYPPAEVVGYLQALGYSGEYYDDGRWRSLLSDSLPVKQCNAWFWRS